MLSPMPMTRRTGHRSHCSTSRGREPWSAGAHYPWHDAGSTEPMARRATIQLKVQRQLVQSISLDDADIECLIQGCGW